MHQIVVTDTNGTRHHSEPATLDADDLEQLRALFRDLSDLSDLRLETEDGETFLPGRAIVAVELVAL